jgi:hypothetical protein
LRNSLQENFYQTLNFKEMRNVLTLLLFAASMFAVNKGYAQCDAPANLQSGYNTNVTSFTWDPVTGATDYLFEIDWAGGSWGLGEENVATSFFDITGLMQGGNFQWRVKANCTNGTSDYTSALFSTPCVAPQNLSTSNITTTSAVLNWEHVPGINNNNTGFSVSYRLANTNDAWIQLTNYYNNPTAVYLNLSGLAANTAYEWRVRRVCSSSNSDYLTAQFVTQPLPPPTYCVSNGNTNSNWIKYFKLGTINRTSGAEPGGYANLPLSTNLVIGSTNNAGQIQAGFSGNSSNSRFMIWIDFNRDGVFSNTERVILTTTAASISGTNIKNFAINIPATATAGPTRMRVFHIKNAGNVSNSCLTGYLGETEDYTVNLVTSVLRISESKSEIDGFEKTSLIAFSAAPNPSTGLFKVVVPNNFEATSYEVFNINGTAVEKNIINEKGGFEIDLSNHGKGVYLLVVLDEKGNKQSTKLLLQ